MVRSVLAATTAAAIALAGKAAYAADLVGRATVLDKALGYDRMPTVMRIEVAQDVPYGLDRRVDDCAPTDLDLAHGSSGA